MASFEHTVEIDRPMEDVFAFLADPASLPRPRIAGAPVVAATRRELAANALRLKHLLEENRPR